MSLIDIFEIPGTTPFDTSHFELDSNLPQSLII